MTPSIGIWPQFSAICILVAAANVGLAQASRSTEVAPEEAVPAKEILDVSHLAGVQWGPLGALWEVRAAHRFMLFSPDSHLILKEAFVGLGAAVSLSPSFFYYGPSITLAPLTILRVDFDFYHVMMGVLKTAYGVLDYNEVGQFGDYTFQYRQEHGSELGHRTAKTWAFAIRPSFRIKAKWFILLYQGKFIYYRPGDFKGLFFNYLVGMVTSHKSWSLVHDVMVLAELTSLEQHGTAFRVGVNSNLINILPDGETALEKTKQWRVGPMFAWTIKDSIAGGSIQNPTILGMFHFYAFDAIADPDIKREVALILGASFNTDWYASVGK